MTRHRLRLGVQIVVPMAREFTNKDCVTIGVTIYEKPPLFAPSVPSVVKNRI
jgi:hypothetical protein